jgi:beta-glucosidase
MTGPAQGFLWGTATAAHQVEGGNWNSDWWAWEHHPDSPCMEPSGDACDQYHRFEEDMELLAGLGFNAYRFSIEWARIEPEEGEFSSAQLEHYRRVLLTCREKEILPVVTFHHFTSPRWIAAKGGWANPVTAERFARYCDRAARHLGDLIGMACTINEPNIVARFGYEEGRFPPGERDPGACDRANTVFADAHHRARDAIKTAVDGAPVGITLAMSDYQAVEGGEDKLAAMRGRDEDVYLEEARDDDFLGVQTYTRTRVGPTGVLAPEQGADMTLMGYEFYPEALEATIRRAHEMAEGTAVLVTENGIATDQDERRIEYVTRALRGMQACLKDDIDVRGYFYWSFLDNFEWAFGYRPTFGLVAVDRRNFVRAPKPSAEWLGGIARGGAMPM